MRRRLLRFAAYSFECFSFLVFCGWLVGQITRDRSWVCGLLFYIPTPVVTLMLIALVPIIRTRRRYLCAAAVLLPIFVLVFEENRFWSSRRDTANSCRLVHWNLCHPVHRWPEQKRHLLSLKPDIVVLSEITDAVLDSDFAGYQVLRQGTLLLACRGTAKRLDPPNARIVPGGVILGFIARCEFDSPSLESSETVSMDVLVADHTSNLTIPRDPWLRQLMLVAESNDVDVIVGDMNAPRRSLAFTKMPTDFQHAYDAAGSGWSYTWPVPVPVLAIDQCIIGKRIVCTSYSLDSTTLSDHRLQLIDFQKTAD
ncbi:MAG: hypothetical protein JNL58_13665 [Planctomyces sp.]|nr:hypothetical protein [Planctomyces sp.]